MGAVGARAARNPPRAIYGVRDIDPNMLFGLPAFGHLNNNVGRFSIMCAAANQRRFHVQRRAEDTNTSAHTSSGRPESPQRRLRRCCVDGLSKDAGVTSGAFYVHFVAAFRDAGIDGVADVARADASAREAFTAELLKVANALIAEPGSGAPTTIEVAYVALATLIGALTLARAVNDPTVAKRIASAAERELAIERTPRSTATKVASHHPRQGRRTAN